MLIGAVDVARAGAGDASEPGSGARDEREEGGAISRRAVDHTAHEPRVSEAMLRAEWESSVQCPPQDVLRPVDRLGTSRGVVIRGEVVPGNPVHEVNHHCRCFCVVWGVGGVVVVVWAVVVVVVGVVVVVVVWWWWCGRWWRWWWRRRW